LRDVWDHFLENAAKTDPGCRAKEAALTALDQLQILDPDPFLPALRYVQLEPVAGGRVDTAGGVRLRGLCALLRMHHSDAGLFAGELLADADAPVRSGVCRALGRYGTRASASLLLHKLHAGDEDPVVISEAASALLELASDVGLELLGRWLRSPDERRREAAALALGQSSDEAAIALLVEWLEEGLGDRDFELGARGLGLSRSDAARRALLGVVRHGAAARAEQAVVALGVHSYDPHLAERVREAAASNGRARLGGLVDRIFGPES
jgi:HEAT repeat protein